MEDIWQSWELSSTTNIYNLYVKLVVEVFWTSPGRL